MVYEPEFFSKGRVLKECSLEYWRKSQSETGEQISAQKKVEIITTVCQYFGNTRMRIELG